MLDDEAGPGHGARRKLVPPYCRYCRSHEAPAAEVGRRGRVPSIRSATLTLNDVNVLVGANGAGKSNFIRALSVLGRIVDGELGLFVGLSGGANALLNVDRTVSRRIHLEVESDVGGYSAELVPAAGDALIFSAETIWRHDTGVTAERGRGHRETMLTEPEPLWGPEAAALVETLRGCRVFHFHDTSLMHPLSSKATRLTIGPCTRMRGISRRSCCACGTAIVGVISGSSARSGRLRRSSGTSCQSRSSPRTG